MDKINIVIGESQFLIRTGLETLINGNSKFALKGQFEEEEDMLSVIASIKPDVVILDYLSKNFSIEYIKKIRDTSLDSRILVISTDLVRENIFRAIELGANSFVTKNCSEQEIINAIIATSKNERFFCNRILEVFINNSQEKLGLPQSTDLTSREIEILQLIGKGHSTKELAALLHLSPHTIYTHRKNMMKKLGANSSTDMVLAAVNLGLIKSTRKTA